MDASMRVWKLDENWTVTESLKYLPINFLSITKGKTVKIVRKPDPHHLRQVIEDNSTNNSTNLTSGPSGWMSRGRHNITPGVLPLQIHHPDLITRKHQTNPNRVTFYKINGLDSSKMSRLKKEKDQLEIKNDWGTVLVQKKQKRCDNRRRQKSRGTAHYWRHGQNLQLGCRVSWWYCINVRFPNLDNRTVTNKTMSLFLGNEHCSV